ncbi:MAG: PHP domain-containing protein [Clostridia bacterium]|nr:PHP domain-containing protein [Clostridia bacterium]
MKLRGDYHTHSIYSHGKGTIMENALNAKKAGLEELAITDHGYGHRLYAMKREALTQMREEAKIAERESNIKILIGAEANFTSPNGDIDLTPQDIENLDIILVGMHRFVKCKTKDFFTFFLPNILRKKASKNQIERNTTCILNALDKYPIDIITHPKYGMPFDVERVAKKAIEKGTLIELNESKMCFSEEEIRLMVDLGVKFVINSDAHEPQKIGQTPKVFEIVEKYNIPKENIFNLK